MLANAINVGHMNLNMIVIGMNTLVINVVG